MRRLAFGYLLLAFGVGSAVAQMKSLDPIAPAPKPPAATGDAKSVFFCFWNVENLFDDKDDRRNRIDEEYDNPFAEDAKLRQLKLDRLAETLWKMNGGKGPDIIACAEVESIRAAELLMGTLNKTAKNPADKYRVILMKNLDAGRHISPCVITRLAVSQSMTKLHGGNLRILETHIYENGHDLCLLATHWTSQLRQEDGSQGDAGRNKYARTIYDLYTKIAEKKPETDFLVCGDFNETPDAPAIAKGLNATGDRKRLVKSAENPFLLDLFANRDPRQFGTIWFQNQPLIYDHICVSPGLLDGDGWGCDPDSVKTFTDGLIRPGATRREPWRFGDPNRDLRETDRGYSDHFPVTVTLTVAPKKAPPPLPPKKP
jgi:endonuclease/exonuclease/phosphatase family metal-dependent hydrolase